MPIIDTTENKWIFIKNELFGMAWNASVQHNKVYRDNIDMKFRNELQTFIQNYIEESIIIKGTSKNQCF